MFVLTQRNMHAIMHVNMETQRAAQRLAVRQNGSTDRAAGRGEKGESAMGTSDQLVVELSTSDAEIAVQIRDKRPETVAAFRELPRNQRHELALDAWFVGLRALANTYAHANETRLDDIGKSLLDDIDRQLRAYVETQQQTISGVLSKFFDPRDGQVMQRLSA
jgi:hypothetical protein